MVSKEQFISVYKKYPAKNWIKFAFKYFSKSTEAENMKLSQSIAWVLMILFLGGLLGTIFELPDVVVGILTFSFAGLLAILVLFLLAAVLSNNKRIKKIAKELNVTLSEYNKLSDRYKEDLK